MTAVTVRFQFNNGAAVEARDVRMSRIPCAGEYVRISQVGPVFVVMDILHTPDGDCEALVNVDVVRPSRVPR